jgi:hypothetical protein
MPGGGEANPEGHCMRFEKQTFDHTEVTLDNNEFIDCTIVDCTLIFHGGPMSVANTRVAGVQYRLMDFAVHTTRFLARLRVYNPPAFEKLMQQALNDEPSAQLTTGSQ